MMGTGNQRQEATAMGEQAMTDVRVRVDMFAVKACWQCRGTGWLMRHLEGPLWARHSRIADVLLEIANAEPPA